jgi:lipopolysaccharide biosynthesis protein
VRQQTIEQDDCALIEREEGLVMDFFARPGTLFRSVQDAIRLYVRSWATGIDLRKPAPGFHPGVYLELHGVSEEHRDPLADFIREGRPEGPWLSAVISPDRPAPVRSLATPRRALHIHAFHPELLSEIVTRLQGQDLTLDLLISVPSEEAANQIRQVLNPIAHMPCKIHVVPNRGRDIGPLITEFGSLILDRYDIIGHVHTKKSPHIDNPLLAAKVWADFLYENLLGGRHPMATRILDGLAADEGLGLVFPDDPYAWGWTKNKTIAEGIAAQLGLDGVPEQHFQFPVGTMFWARTTALKPLLALGWEWDAYPEEPLPIDGTLLHAIERLLPSIAIHTGHRIATTHVPGVTR